MGEAVVPDPAGFSTPGDLAIGLKALLRRSGLSYAQLGQVVARLPSDRSRVPVLPKSTVSDMLKTGRMSRPALLAFLVACKVPEADAVHWIAAWERARTAERKAPIHGTLTRALAEFGVGSRKLLSEVVSLCWLAARPWVNHEAHMKPLETSFLTGGWFIRTPMILDGLRRCQRAK